MEECIDLERALGVAIKAALSAGDIMRKFYQHRREDVAAMAAREKRENGSQSADAADDSAAPQKRSVNEMLSIKTKTSAADLVTHFDTLCDKVIIETLQQYNAEVEAEKKKEGCESFRFRVITEELSPDAPLTDDPTWIVDPIDGTLAFVHGGCDCCVSIGLAIKKKSVLGVVYCPFLGNAHNMVDESNSTVVQPGELFTAIRGKGAFLNGQAIRTNGSALTTQALVSFGCPMGARLSDEEKSRDKSEWDAIKHEKHLKILDANGRIRQRLAMHPVHGVRSYGACALILAHVAAGRVDIYMEPAGMVWDVCAGSLLVTEAGGAVKTIWGSEFGLEGSTTVIAGSNEELAEFAASLCQEVKYGDFWKK